MTRKRETESLDIIVERVMAAQETVKTSESDTPERRKAIGSLLKDIKLLRLIDRDLALDTAKFVRKSSKSGTREYWNAGSHIKYAQGLITESHVPAGNQRAAQLRREAGLQALMELAQPGTHTLSMTISEAREAITDASQRAFSAIPGGKEHTSAVKRLLALAGVLLPQSQEEARNAAATAARAAIEGSPLEQRATTFVKKIKAINKTLPRTPRA